MILKKSIFFKKMFKKFIPVVFSPPNKNKILSFGGLDKGLYGKCCHIFIKNFK